MQRIDIVRTVAITSIAAILSTGAIRSQEGPGQDVAATREALAQWVETNRLISKERANWVVEKQLLEDRIAIVGDEIERTRAATREAEEGIGQLDTELDGLLATDAKLDEAVGVLESEIAAAEARLKGLLPLLPDPLLGEIELLSKRLPDDPATTEVKLSSRFITVAGILQLIDRFQMEVKTDSTLITLPDGTNAEVATLHLGLGQAFYATTDGRHGGIGRPAAEGWVWTAANESAPQILQAIAIADGESGPAYVQLPILAARP